ncbi:hypothetical protein SeMB42_g03746 [Synchytrium endobioticum]|uniref:Urease accessory protein UreF n=1 Tax=Synchytrium endobioticum TaxID=286115 RepID=A0A507CSR1_9FUNG|nr:hypothetical protein SeLEV6574_g05736 [Synchytrium endobioticum]TPX46305.1 hypothetical protein SeMB42_g03746 [Synchytrium endobioticum]
MDFPMFDSSDGIIWMLADSALPTGGFVASGALEVAVQSKHITTLPSLLDFLSQSIHACGHSAGITTISTYDASCDDQSPLDKVVDGIVEIDAYYDACMTNHVARRASRTQGSAHLTLMSRAFDGEGRGRGLGSGILTIYKNRVRAGKSPGHLPVCFALVCKDLSLSRDKTLHLFLFLHARSMVSAAVRLNVVGPYQGQSILMDLQPHVSDVCQQVQDKKMDDIHSSAPVIDLLQGLHDNLYSRLFNS